MHPCKAIILFFVRLRNTRMIESIFTVISSILYGHGKFNGIDFARIYGIFIIWKYSYIYYGKRLLPIKLRTSSIMAYIIVATHLACLMEIYSSILILSIMHICLGVYSRFFQIDNI